MIKNSSISLLILWLLVSCCSDISFSVFQAAIPITNLPQINFSWSVHFLVPKNPPTNDAKPGGFAWCWWTVEPQALGIPLRIPLKQGSFLLQLAQAFKLFQASQTRLLGTFFLPGARGSSLRPRRMGSCNPFAELRSASQQAGSAALFFESKKQQKLKQRMV